LRKASGFRLQAPGSDGALREACRSPKPEARSLRRALCLTLALLLAAPPALAVPPDKALRAATRAYDSGDYATVIKLLRPLLHPTIRLSNQAQVISAFGLLGISYIFEKNKTEAEKQFMAILALQPDFRFDAQVDPAAAVELLEDLKRRNAEKLKAIRERERQEAERRKRDEEARRRREEEARRAAQRPSVLFERTVQKHPYWVNFVPLGAGQFQNGQRRKGYALMITELGLGATSLATGISSWVLYSRATRTENGLRVSQDEYNRLRGLSIVQVVTGALCLGTIAYGIIDALVYYKPQSVTERQLPLPPAPAPKVTVSPMGAGLELGVKF
jgi:hypothetical protein